MVLCFRDVFNYLSAILGSKELNGDLKYKMKTALSILFIGFKYDKWYFKLILQLLNLEEKAIKQASIKEIENSQKEPDEQNLVIDFYKNEFKIRFVSQEGTEIVDLLHKHYKEKDLLRKPKKEINTVQSITNVINVNDSKDVTILQNVNDSNINLNKTNEKH